MHNSALVQHLSQMRSHISEMVDLSAVPPGRSLNELESISAKLPSELMDSLADSGSAMRLEMFRSFRVCAHQGSEPHTNQTKTMTHDGRRGVSQ